jgi:c-di-GMP-binding flagellar brake protein YcgR
MNDPANRRRYARVNVGGDHTVRFKLGERSMSGLAMTNLSAGGCCIRIPSAQAEAMDKGTLVSMLYLVHPRIPNVPLEAVVCWLLGKQPGKTDGFVLVGFEFVDPSPQFQETLDAYVKELMG